MKKNLIFAAVLCVALVFGFSSCENPDDNEELLERIEQLENQLKDQQSGKDEDKTNSADKDGDKDNSSDNEQSGGSSEENAGGSGEGTPDPDEGEEGGDEGGSSSSTTGTENGYEWVDLGLPSGLRWATCNVGASSPEEFGCYFAWGETTPKTEYNWSTYKFMNSSIDDWNGVNKYTFADGQTEGVWYDNSGNFIGDNKTILDPEDDAAAVNMGGSWRMPTIEEIAELIDECTWTWTTLNGVNGYNVEGPNGNSIFLPAAGYRSYSDLYGAGSYGNYWSGSLYTNNSGYAYNLYFYSDGAYWDDGSDRYFGRSVRGVFS
ncbi:MAG: DUF1566 domain-containing protein [Paludibacteraceae bacterium]|nr:DUF1566 domain-containing protein [Paludibacteraceae bacterium]